MCHFMSFRQNPWMSGPITTQAVGGPGLLQLPVRYVWLMFRKFEVDWIWTAWELDWSFLCHVVHHRRGTCPATTRAVGWHGLLQLHIRCVLLMVWKFKVDWRWIAWDLDVSFYAIFCHVILLLWHWCDIDFVHLLMQEYRVYRREIIMVFCHLTLPVYSLWCMCAIYIRLLTPMSPLSARQYFNPVNISCQIYNLPSKCAQIRH